MIHRILLVTLLIASFMAGCSSPEKSQTKEAVAFSLAKESGSFQECGELAENRTSKAPNGKILLSWDIDKFGYAKNIVVDENSTEDSILAECLKEKVKNVKFPTSEIVKEYKVKFPFVFKN
ncbi:MAG: AgmX/PglI C-terminal domain-containing protein [Bdellovibrionaceae bacterium]|nr:AgmX/PglI C-terminal domain-containing protein [Pseudobdellovibrionaceae bacterium]